MSANDWTPAALERLRVLWAEGHSTAEIGRRLGVSKNAIVGKAYRLNLPARPSPIIVSGAPRVTTPSQAVRREAALAGTRLIKIPQREAAVPATAKSRPSGRRAAAEVRAKPVIGCPGAVAETAAGGSPAPIETTHTVNAASVTPPTPIAPEPPATIFKFRPPGGCCWPMWRDRERPTFVYCDAPRPAGRIYCDAHARVAYVRSTGASTAPALSVPNSENPVCTSIAPSRSLSGTIRSEDACRRENARVQVSPS